MAIPIRINPVENKEYLPFTTLAQDNANSNSGNHIGVSQEPLFGEPTKVENVPKDFVNGIPLQFDRDTSAKVRCIPKGKRSKPIGIMQGAAPYDLLEDLGKLKADISIKQLFGIAPSCRSLLQSTLVRKRLKPIVNEVTISPDPGAPTVDVVIDGIVLQGVQLDGGSSVNLMNLDTMTSLQLTGLQDTKLMLRMADQSRVQLMGILPSVKTTIAGNSYWIDYIIFQPNSPHASYPILLGRLWLKEAKAKQDWSKGLLTSGSGARKVTLGMYHDQYHGEIQWESPKVTTQFGYDSDNEKDVVANRVHNHVSARTPLDNRTGTF